MDNGSYPTLGYIFWAVCACVVGVTLAAGGASIGRLALSNVDISSFITNGLASAQRSVASLAERAHAEIERSTAVEEESSKIDLGYLAAADVTVPEEGRFVLADLQAMEISLFEDGNRVATYAILSIGKKGSPWETPAGAYEIKTKEENHFSSIGEVWMPYSMQFFGNFFIHGWPYYPDGTPVAAGYSGGCIRLATEDAAQIFAFVSHGTSLAVINPNGPAEVGEGKAYYLKDPKSTAPKSITAGAYLVADLDSGDILLQKNKDDVRAIASLTKLMTALVSLETVNQFQNTTVSNRAVGTYGAAGSLTAGMRLTTGDTLYPLLLESSNDAAEVLAEHAGHAQFMGSMNAKAQSIGLLNTSYEDPSGLSKNNVSTAADLMQLTQYIYQNKRYILDVTKLKQYVGPELTWHNNSRFKAYEGYIGGKNGYIDESKHTLIALFSVPLGGETRNIGIVILASDNKQEDADALLSYVRQNIAYGTAAEFAEADISPAETALEHASAILGN